jgi:lipopolysaccharide export system protein LptA
MKKMGKRRSSRPARTGTAVLILVILGAVTAMADKYPFSADKLDAELAKGRERILLKGHARIDPKDTSIRADEMELYGEDYQYAICRGNVRAVNTKKGIEIQADELFYDNKAKITRVKGNAVMYDFENEMVLKAGFIEDKDEEDLTIMQIQVRILKKDLVCRSEFARYQREKDLLELSGMPFVSRKGDEYRAARIRINLDTEEITLEGDVKGEITETEESKPANNAKEEPPAEESKTIE